MGETRSKNYYTSGEFAKICLTTKETLRHYDEVGILQPAYVGENGYRYYRTGQFFDYDLILTLKEAGCSLAEIKNYMEHYEAQDFLAVMQDKLQQLEEEKRKIESMQKLLKYSIESTEYALTEEYYKPRLIECEEEYLITIKVDHGETQTFSEEVERIRDHFLHLDNHDLWEEYSIGSIILQDTLEQGKYYESYYYTRIHSRREDERLQIKPAGQYVTMLHKGPYSKLPESYQIMKEFIQEQGLRLCGNGYEYDMISHLATQKMENYIIQLSVQVCPEEDAKGFSAAQNQVG